jgi:prevent-host-death family protein
MTMRERESETKSMKASEVRQQFSSVINHVARDEARVIVEKNGLPVAAIVPAKDLRHLKRVDADIAERKRVLEMMRAPFRGVPAEEIEREAERAWAEVRAEMRAERKQAASAK